MPTPADVQGRLSGKRIVTVIDMKDDYWHDSYCNRLCTFNTPWEGMHFLRMPSGVLSASQVMQKRNDETLGDTPGAFVLDDDINIAAAIDEEHGAILLDI